MVLLGLSSFKLCQHSISASNSSLDPLLLRNMESSTRGSPHSSPVLPRRVGVPVEDVLILGLSRSRIVLGPRELCRGMPHALRAMLRSRPGCSGVRAVIK